MNKRAEILNAHKHRFATKAFDKSKKLATRTGKRSLKLVVYHQAPSVMNPGSFF